MSTGFNCKCAERKKPIKERNWEVIKRKYHNSAFSGYYPTRSTYSTLRCRSCEAVGRTNAQYVDDVKDCQS